MRDRTTTHRTRRSSRTARDVGRERVIAALAVAVLFVAGGAGLALIAPRAPVAVATAAKVWKTVVATETPAPTDAPTPVFASLRGVPLHLPIPACDVTTLAFHQSSYADTVALTSLVRFDSPTRARAAATAARATIKAGGVATIAATPLDASEDASGTWTGSALELWRSARNVKQDTAVDCGAAPGTPVISPVDGTVMQIRPYKLYKRVDDFEIHIKPDAWNDLDVIILHVTDPLLVPGARVVAGVTQVAKVRRLSNVVSGLQLRNYSLDGGNHTHFQINRIPRPNDTWVLGQDPPGLVRHY